MIHRLHFKLINQKYSRSKDGLIHGTPQPSLQGEVYRRNQESFLGLIGSTVTVGCTMKNKMLKSINRFIPSTFQLPSCVYVVVREGVNEFQ